MSTVVYNLRDRNPEMIDAWREQFTDAPGVSVSQGDIFDDAPLADAIVSPANSFGFMDGGIDLAYVEHFGWDLQDRLQAKLRGEHGGELPVGCAVIVETNSADIPLMISAPTMWVPMNVAETTHAYLAFRAAIRAVNAYNAARPSRPIRSVLCPGLCTAIGRMPHRRAAKQMLLAYLINALGRSDFHDRAHKVLYNHMAMTMDQPIRSE